MSATGVLVSSLFIALVLADASSSLAESASSHANESALEPQMVPIMEPLMERLVPINDSRRKLAGGFKVCAPCTCCGGGNKYCLPSPCCYSINCNIPNRPFGSCAFSPTACNCYGCHV